MKLEVGKIGNSGGSKPWRILNDAGSRLKTFFVLREGARTISLRITILEGSPLTEEEWSLVQGEIQRQRPDSELTPRYHVQEYRAPR